MSDLEDGNATARGKRSSAVVSIAGRRERRAPASKDLDIELSKPTRRALLPASAADNSSDRSEDTGIEATDALPAEDARQAVLRKAVPRKPVPELDLQTTPSGSDEESPALTPKAAKAAAKAAKKADKAPSKTANGTEEVAVRQRPTNNQLLYKARFNWEHYVHPVSNGTREMLPSETQACASVTSAFLQVLKAIHTAEMHRLHGGRNILKLLSVNTRRTKVVAMSTGTHRVPDELRRHQLADDDGNEYSTNLDRNRYGADDQYLFTVIKFNLEALGLCPLICQVEIIDAKAGAGECLVVKVPLDRCSCNGEPTRGGRLDRVICGGSASQNPKNAYGKIQRAPESTGKSDRAQWRVPTQTPCSPLKRAASAGDAGGMGVLLDALTQVGGMPPPSPLHLRSPSHAQRRQSFLGSAGGMAAASPSMRPAAAAMSALCEEAPPSVTRPEGAGGVGGVAAAAAAAAAAHFYGVGTPLGGGTHSMFFQSPPAMREAARHAAAAIANAGGGAGARYDAYDEDFDGRVALEELVERVSGQAASAKVAEAKAVARIGELEDLLAAATAPTHQGEVNVVSIQAQAVEQKQNADDAFAKFATETAGRVVALEEEVAAFGARVTAAVEVVVSGATHTEAMVAALYFAEAQAHARVLTRLARLEAAAATAAFLKQERSLATGTFVAPKEPTARTAEQPAVSPENVADIAEQAASEKRNREDDGDCAFEPPAPPAKRVSGATGRDAMPMFGSIPRNLGAKAVSVSTTAGYAPPSTPCLTQLDTGVVSPPNTDPATRLSFAGHR